MRLTLEEAKAMGLNVNAVSDQENLVESNLDGFRERMRSKFTTMDINAPKKKRKTIEDNDAEKLCSRLNANKYKFVHTPNESGMGGKHAMLVGLKKKRMGLSPGFPDFCIYLKNGIDLYIELKKPRTKKLNGELKALSSDGIKCSDEQKEWIKYLSSRKGHRAFFGYGFDYSLKIIKHHEENGLS